MQFNFPFAYIPTTDNARQDGEKASAWLNMAVGYFDKICTCSSSYSQDQVENEILSDECTVRNEAYWRTVEEALSAQDSVDDADANDQSASVERERTTRISVDAFITTGSSPTNDAASLGMPSIQESPCPSDTASPGTNVLEPLVLSPRSATPPMTCGKPQFVMDMSSEYKSKHRNAGRSGRRMRKCRSIFLRTSRALDYHSLGSVESFERRSKLLAESEETSLASMSTAPTEFSSSQRSNVLVADANIHIPRLESRLEAKLRSGSHKESRRRPSAREMMDNSVHSLPYLSMSQGYEV
eukprot:CAMPEP_0185799936 /NCGR_PEP_ID=MMETSP1322-20130828/600_1 /TAXON_ID=265543 /ORGANISM="Minutocellus polymorphus, Strain RCC2270" /LENGTH=297 /DNA_ID=CAMNT_0028495543 /DNA_START=159 /DNA_END=1052 /DNA_ORIENTATION=+